MSAEIKEDHVDESEAEEHQSINHQDRELSSLSNTLLHIFISF